MKALALLNHLQVILVTMILIVAIMTVKATQSLTLVVMIVAPKRGEKRNCPKFADVMP